MAGYFKIDRSILDWEWYSDINVRLLWYHLLAIANYKDLKWRGKTIFRGQIVTSLKSLSNGSGLSERQTRTAIDKLLSTGEITKQATNGYTIITICKYAFYQDNKEIERQTDDKRMTNERQTDDKRATTSKESKEYKEDKERNNNSTSSSRACASEMVDCKEFFARLNVTELGNSLTTDTDVLNTCVAEFKAYHDLDEPKEYREWHKNFCSWVMNHKHDKQKQEAYGNKPKYDPTMPYEPRSKREDYFL